MTPAELADRLQRARSGDSTVFGAIPSNVTAKDYVALPAAPSSAPAFTHSAVGKLPVKSQQGSTCCGNSISLCMEYNEYAESRRIIEFDGEELNARVTHVEGAGAMPADVLDFVAKFGIEGQVDSEKGVYLPKAYARLDHTNIEAVKAAISTPGQMVTIAIWLQDNFGENKGKTFPHYDANQPAPAYHEVTIVGYNADGLLIQNSWGTWWGDGGFCRLAWDYLTSDRCGECWVITDNADTAGGYIKTYTYDVNAKERAVKHIPTPTSTRPAVYLVKDNGRFWIKDPFEAKRFGVDLSKVEKLPDTDIVWSLPVIGPDAPPNAR